MTDPLRLPLAVYRRVAAVSLLAPPILFLVTPISRVVLLELALMFHWASIAWVDARRRDWSHHRVVTAFCAAEWSAAVAITAVDGWLLHFTSIMCLGPVILAIQVTDTRRYRQLVVAAIGTIAGISVLGQSTTPGPIRSTVGHRVVDTAAIVTTPVLVGLVALVAWLIHRAMLERKDLLMHSRRRLAQADQTAQLSFRDFSHRMQERIGGIRHRLLDRDPTVTLGDLNAEIQEVATQIRTAGHSIGAPAQGLGDREHVRKLVAEHRWPIDVRTAPIDDLDPVVESVARAVITDSFAAVQAPRSSSLTLGESAGHFAIDIEHDVDDASDGDVRLGLLTRDRIDAIDGTRHEDCDRGRITHRVRLPLSPPSPAPSGTAPRTPRRDLLPTLVLPLAALVVTLVVWAVALPEPGMLRIAALLTLLFVAPCAAAMLLANDHPQLAVSTVVGSYWVTTLAIVDQASVLKWFAAIALLVPLLHALPHASRAVFTALAVGTGAMSTATIVIARLTSELPALAESPDAVARVVATVMVPLCSGVVLYVSAANHAAMARTADDLARSRRSIVAAADAAQRRIERDLHDGTQQRLVSAALRTQIAARLDDPVSIAKNVAAAASELDRAAESLAGLAAGTHDPDVAHDGVGLALRRLAASSPLQVRVNIDGEPRSLPDAVCSTIWFCCAEALTNAAKYAGPSTHVDIDLRCEPREVAFDVSDDGCGFPASGELGQGLRNMAERLEQAGGALMIRSRVGHGTTICGRIPR